MRWNLVVLSILALATSPLAAQPVRLLYAPAGSDDPVLRSEIASELGGGIVDYFDARFGTPSASLLLDYDAVYTWAPLAYSNPNLFGDRLADYYEAGGRVILGMGCAQATGIGGRIAEYGYMPVDLDAPELYSSGVWSGGDVSSNLYDHVDELRSDSYEDLSHRALGVADGRFFYSPLAVIRRGNRLMYLNGRPVSTSYGQGDWPRFIANAARLGNRTRALIYEPSIADGLFEKEAYYDGLQATIANTFGELETEIATGDYDVVVLAEENFGIPLSVAEALQDHVEAGGRAILSYFDLDGSTNAASASVLRATFGVANTTSFAEPRTIWPWSEDSRVYSYSFDIEPDPSFAFDNGDAMTPASGAVAVAGFTENQIFGQGAIIVANQGRTVVNGFLFDDYWVGWQGLLASPQLSAVANQGSILLAAGRAEHEYLARAAHRMGLETTRVTTVGQMLDELALRPYDAVIIDEVSGVYDLPQIVRLAEFVNDGGKVLASDPDLMDSIGMADLFGVFTSQALTEAVEFQPTAATHPTFLAPHVLTEFGLEPLPGGSEHGNALQPTGGAQAIAAFPSLAGPVNAAIVVANENRTIMNGFLLDDLDRHLALDLAENQLSFLLGSGGGDFIRGDCNRDGSVELADVITGLGMLFSGDTPSACPAACDTNADQSFDVADAVSLLGYLFIAGSPAPTAPFPGCGSVPSALDCAASAACP